MPFTSASESASICLPPTASSEGVTTELKSPAMMILSISDAVAAGEAQQAAAEAERQRLANEAAAEAQRTAETDEAARNRRNAASTESLIASEHQWTTVLQGMIFVPTETQAEPTQAEAERSNLATVMLNVMRGVMWNNKLLQAHLHAERQQRQQYQQDLAAVTADVRDAAMQPQQQQQLMNSTIARINGIEAKASEAPGCTTDATKQINERIDHVVTIIGDIGAADIDVPCSPASIRKYRDLLIKAHANMQKAEIRMQQQANRRRLPCPFREGDLVWVLSEEFALEQDVSRKFLPKWFGPWEVTSAVGDDPAGPSFVINIPPHLTVHRVFHASKLAIYTPLSADEFPGHRSQDPPSMDGHQEVDRVITHRKYGNKPRQYKVTFKQCAPDDTRWISSTDLQTSAPLIFADYEKRRPAKDAARSTLDEDGEAFDSAAEELESDHWDTGSARSGPGVGNRHHRRLSSSVLGYDYDEAVQQSRMHQCVRGSPLKEKEGPLFKANRIGDQGLSCRSSLSPYGNRQGTQIHSEYGNGVAGFAERNGLLSNGKMDTAVACASPIKDLFCRHPSWQQKSRELTRGGDILSPKQKGGSPTPRQVEVDVSQNEGSLQVVPNEGSPRRSYDALEREMQSLRAENEELENALRAANSNSAQLAELQQYVQFVEERYEELLELYRTSEERVNELKDSLEEEEAIREAMEEDIAIAKQGMNHEEQVRELQVKLLRSERERRELEILLKEAEGRTPSTVAEDQVVDTADDLMREEYQQKIKELEDEATTLTYENVDQARRVARLVQELAEKDSVISELMAMVDASQSLVVARELPENGVRETGTDRMEDWQSERAALEAQIAQLAEEKEQSIATVRSETAAEMERLTLEIEERMAEVREARMQADMTISGLQHQIESMQTELAEERCLRKNAEMRIGDGELRPKEDCSAICQFRVEASLGVANTNLPSGNLVGDSSSMVSNGGPIDGCDCMEEFVPEVKDPNPEVRRLTILNVKLMEEANSRESSGMDSTRVDDKQGTEEEREEEEEEKSMDKPSVAPGSVTCAPLLKPPIDVNVQCVEADKESADKPSVGPGENVTCAPLLGPPTVASVQYVEAEALGQVAIAGSREEDQCPKECCVSDIMTTQASVEANLKNLEILPGLLAKEATEANMDAEREVLLSADQAVSDSLEKLSVEVPRLEDIIARLESEVQSRDTSDDDLSVDVQQLVDIIARLECEVQKRETSVDDLTIALRRQEEGWRQAEEENNTLRVTLQELGIRLQEEFEKRSAAVEELDRNRERMEKELEKAKSCTLFANASLEKISDKVAELEEAFIVKERAIAELEAQKAKLESELQQEDEQSSDADEVINPSPQKIQKPAQVFETPMEVLNASIKKLSDDVARLTETLHLKENVICQLQEDKMRLEEDLCAFQLHSTQKHDMERDEESCSDVTEDMAQTTSAPNEFLSEHIADANVLHGMQMETTGEERLEPPCAVRVEAEALGSALLSETKPADVRDTVTAETGDNSAGSEELSPTLSIAEQDSLRLLERTMDLTSHRKLEENLASSVLPARDDDALTRSKELELKLRMVQAEKQEVLQRLCQLQEQLMSVQGGESMQRSVEPQIEKLEDQLRTSETEKNHARICVKELETKLQVSEAEKQEALHRTADDDLLQAARDQLTSVSAARDSALVRVKELESELVEVKAEKQEALQRTAASQIRMEEVELLLAQRHETMMMWAEELEAKPLADMPENEEKPVHTPVEESPFVRNDALAVNCDLPPVEPTAVEEEKQDHLQRNAEPLPGESEEKRALTEAEGDCAQNVHVDQEIKVTLLTSEAGSHKKSIEEAELSGNRGLNAESTFVEAGADGAPTRSSESQSKPFITEPEEKDSLHSNAGTQVCGFATGNNSTVVCNSGHGSENPSAAWQSIVQAKIKALVEGLGLATAAIDGSVMHNTVFEPFKGKELKAVMKIVKELEAIVQMVVSKDDSCLFCSWGDEPDVPIVDSRNDKVVPRIVKVELKVLGEDFTVDSGVADTPVMHSTESKLKFIELGAEEPQGDIEGKMNFGKAEGDDDGLVGGDRATSQRSNLQMLSARDELDLPQVTEKCPQTLDEQLAMAVFARRAALDHQRELELKLAAVEAEKQEAMRKVVEAENVAKELMEDALRRSKELESKLFAVEAEKKAAMQEVENVRAQLSELEKRIEHQISENDALQGRLSASEVEKEDLEKRIVAAEEDSRQTSEEVSKLMNDLATVKHDADEENRFNQAEIVRLNAILESTRRELAAMDAEKEELEIDNSELSSLKSNLCDKLTSAKTEMAVYKQTISNLELELSRLREAAEQERLARAAEEAVLSSLHEEKTVLEERVQQAEEARAKMEEELRLNMEKLRSKVQSLTEKLSMSDSQKQALESQASNLAADNEELKEQLKHVEEAALAGTHESDSIIRELEKTTAYLEDELKLQRTAREEIESRNKEVEAELRDANEREVSTALVLSNLRMEKENLADMMRELESKNKSLICAKEMLESKRDELTEKLLRAEQCLDESRREAALLTTKMRKAESAADDVQEVQTAMQKKMVKQIRALEEECESLLADKNRLEQGLLQKQEELWQRSTEQQNELERLRKENQELSEANAALQRAGSATRSPSHEKTELRQMVMVLQTELRMKVTILHQLVQKRNDDSTSRSLENSGIPSATSDSGEGAVIDKSINLLESHFRHAEHAKEDAPVEHEIERLQVLNKNLTVDNSSRTDGNNMRKESWKQSAAETEELRQEHIVLKLQLAEVTTERDQLVQTMNQLKRMK
ncbi:hypothetical protein CBR_g46736 [Chara braunii]|uniref:Uncharacterized protein n=1 Tax=Chara braunii TaxID=69332 RepID=A0A388K3Z6_CHABU|nr:hypothetical protein CBR_g46736 [Chara braunii]|eukprot:GBG64780.1 hypothetical protein CBR_g46736 [Chara braunii]